jgi:prephenate dehydratase
MRMSIAYQGAPGAFGHQACLGFVPRHAAIARPTFAGVAAAVAMGAVDLGMLPLSNSRAGDVDGIWELIEGSGLAVEEEYRLPVRLHLLGLPGARLEQVDTVCSHPMALKQCAQSLSRLGLRGSDAPNTALAAKSLSRPTAAALASEAAAEIYGLDIILRDLQDDPDNSTLFALVRRR